MAPTAGDVAAAHYAQRQRLAVQAARAAQRAWRQIDPHAISLSWQGLMVSFLRLLITLQHSAASGSDAYVTAVLRAAGAVPSPVGRVSPAAFAGAASDGRDLGSLLTTPLIDVFGDIDDGMTPGTALVRGMNRLVPIVATQVQDAGRLADQVAMAADTGIDGYVRVVHLPACARCIILAGRVYRYSAGFQRHPACDCTSAPHVAGVGPQDPEALIAEMRRDAPAKLAKSLSGADLRAIDHGANLNQVVNAHRGMSVPGSRTTREGTTRRGLAGQRRPGRQRPTVAGIFEFADRDGWSREQILAQLVRAGYII